MLRDCLQVFSLHQKCLLMSIWKQKSQHVDNTLLNRFDAEERWFNRDRLLHFLQRMLWQKQLLSFSSSCTLHSRLYWCVAQDLVHIFAGANQRLPGDRVRAVEDVIWHTDPLCAQGLPMCHLLCLHKAAIVRADVELCLYVWLCVWL